MKKLEIFSYGLTSLPAEFVNLKSFEELDISANNFTEIPAVLTKENFPNLKVLRMVGSRRWTTSDLRKKDNYDNGLGLHFRSYVTDDNQLRQLMLWDNLEELRLSNCYIEGQLPDFTVGSEGVEAYSQADVDAFGGDTIQWLADNSIPKILPNMKLLSQPQLLYRRPAQVAAVPSPVARVVPRFAYLQPAGGRFRFRRQQGAFRQCSHQL